MSATIDQDFAAATEHHHHGRLAQARALYDRILLAAPLHPDTLHQLGVLEAQSQNPEIAVTLIRRAIELLPDNPLFHGNLGMILESGRRLDEALLCYRHAVQLDPDSADLQFKLGNALRATGNLSQAILCYSQAVRCDPHHAAALNNLGNCLRMLDRHEEALACFQTIVRLNPHDFRAWVNLAGTLRKLDLHADSLAAYRRVLDIQSDDPALAEARAAAQSCIAYARLYDPSADNAALAAELARWNQLRAHPPLLPAAPLDRTPNRRLRIGYVSADFANHVVAQNLIPLFRNHDHSRFQIFCYSNSEVNDSLTEEFRRLSDQFHTIATENDDQAAARVRRDRIDILVDLGLHTAGNRLGLFARKPAPIQATFAGYPGSTGLDTIDYRITDPFLEPPEQANLFAEIPLRLSHCFWCFDPLGDEPAVNELPALSGTFTFGCLNNFAKVNQPNLQLWARLLKRVPNSRLMLLAAPGPARQGTLDFFSHLGIPAQRIEFHSRRPRADYLRLFHQIDLTLDTLPYNGHSTALDSLFMGVPVITLVGQTPVGRAGISQLSNLGTPEWIAQTPEQYLQIASDLAQNLPLLSRHRFTLRDRMRRSPLMNAAQFARDLENLYQQMDQRSGVQ